MEPYDESQAGHRHEHPRRWNPRHGGGSGGSLGRHRRPGPRMRRRFFTREERIASLERYLNDLRAEAQGVEETLARMQAAR